MNWEICINLKTDGGLISIDQRLWGKGSIHLPAYILFNSHICVLTYWGSSLTVKYPSTMRTGHGYAETTCNPIGLVQGDLWFDPTLSQYVGTEILL